MLGLGLLENTLSNFLAPMRTSAVIPYRGEDFGDGLQITEVQNVESFNSKATGGNAAIFLKGTRMPRQPFTFGGTQRITKEYYPGNPEPSMQILGSQEGNITLEGRWHDSRNKLKTDADINNRDVYGISYRLQEYFDALRKRGNLIYLRLGEWERYGYIEETEFQMKTLGDIEWKLTFAIIGKDKPKLNFFADTLREVPLDLALKLAVAASDISTIPKLPFPNDIFSEIQGAVAALASKVATVTKYIDGVLSLAERTIAQIQRCILLITSLRSQIARFKRRLGNLQVNAGSMSSVFSLRERQKWADAVNKSIRDIQHKPSRPVLVAAPQPRANDFLSRTSSITQVADIRTTPSMETLLARLSAQLKAIARTIPIARHRVQEGDTLAKLAMRYYNNADEWKRIHDHNKLSSTLLIAGTVLEVPKL